MTTVAVEALHPPAAVREGMAVGQVDPPVAARVGPTEGELAAIDCHLELEHRGDLPRRELATPAGREHQPATPAADKRADA